MIEHNGKRYVYFIRNPKTGLVKIGQTRYPRSRMSALRSEYGQQLEPLLVIYGDKYLESEMHQRFADYRVEGEWFRPAPVLLQFINDTESELEDPAVLFMDEEREMYKHEMYIKALKMSPVDLVRAVAALDEEWNKATNTEPLKSFLKLQEIAMENRAKEVLIEYLEEESEKRRERNEKVAADLRETELRVAEARAEIRVLTELDEKIDQLPWWKRLLLFGGQHG